MCLSVLIDTVGPDLWKPCSVRTSLSTSGAACACPDDIPSILFERRKMIFDPGEPALEEAADFPTLLSLKAATESSGELDVNAWADWAWKGAASRSRFL